VRRQRWARPGPRYLETTTHLRVRFQEVDALRVVWHGHYLAYFEEGRQAFGREHGISYQDILDAGYVAPLVHAEVDYYAPARLDEWITVHARLHEEQAARIPFTYELRSEDGRKLATGFSVQAFTDPQGELVLTRPAFYADFQRRVEAGSDAPSAGGATVTRPREPRT